MMLTKNFSRSEMECHCGCGLYEMDSKHMNKLQLLRDHCGFPFYLNSARRCKYWNDKSGGYPTSAHLDGLATDIRVTDKALLRVILKHAIDMGFEGIGVADDFIHLDSKKRKNGKAFWLYS